MNSWHELDHKGMAILRVGRKGRAFYINERGKQPTRLNPKQADVLCGLLRGYMEDIEREKDEWIELDPVDLPESVVRNIVEKGNV